MNQSRYRPHCRGGNGNKPRSPFATVRGKDCRTHQRDTSHEAKNNNRDRATIHIKDTSKGENQVLMMNATGPNGRIGRNDDMHTTFIRKSRNLPQARGANPSASPSATRIA